MLSAGAGGSDGRSERRADGVAGSVFRRESGQFALPGRRGRDGPLLPGEAEAVEQVVHAAQGQAGRGGTDREVAGRRPRRSGRWNGSG